MERSCSHYRLGLVQLGCRERERREGADESAGPRPVSRRPHLEMLGPRGRSRFNFVGSGMGPPRREMCCTRVGYALLRSVRTGTRRPNLACYSLSTHTRLPVQELYSIRSSALLTHLQTTSGLTLQTPLHLSHERCNTAYWPQPTHIVLIHPSRIECRHARRAWRHSV